ncbi:protein of unknown function [Rhodoferax sp. OV413]|uniref:DUF934 domain-containing protein n=1 Tax=Rhodoferax sp. OV413 TaxID=1855285 RepID=UPI000884CEAB|nr:DUF934 domain-containing protein [Rhodoferax sp. OV413]SDO07564.1 protein of unknown function [Rhodoferax sp. OV413]
MKIIASTAHTPGAEGQNSIVALANDVDPRTLPLEGVTRIDLNFPKFTDGRAYSQAFLLRRRLGFTGEIRATGDVLIDQLVQMQRSGFDVAVLREGVDASAAQRQFDRFEGFYQGDAVHVEPHFAETEHSAAYAAELARQDSY